MALYHFHADIVTRSAGSSVVASAAYRAGEKLHSAYYGEDADYTHKGGVLCAEIFLPTYAPSEYKDRETLWNAVEKVEKNTKAQLAYTYDFALQNELTMEENIALARRFVEEQFLSRGMIVDFAIHAPDKEKGGIPNPHVHLLCPIRPLKANGKFVVPSVRLTLLPSLSHFIQFSRKTHLQFFESIGYSLTSLLFWGGGTLLSAYVSPNAVIFVTGPYYHESMALAIGVEDDVLCDKKLSKHHYCQDITNLLNLGIPTFWSYHPAYLQRINALHATAAAIASIKC